MSVTAATDAEDTAIATDTADDAATSDDVATQPTMTVTGVTCSNAACCNFFFSFFDGFGFAISMLSDKLLTLLFSI